MQSDVAIQPNSHPEHRDLIEHVKEHIGIRKYIDFIRMIKCILQDEEKDIQEKKKSTAKAKYDHYINVVTRIQYLNPEGKLGESEKNILYALKNIDLKSRLIKTEINKYIERAHVNGSYFKVTGLEFGSVRPTFKGMRSSDRQVLNQEVIAPDYLMPSESKSRQTKESKLNNINDRKLQDAEDALHDVEVEIFRNKQLVPKLTCIIDEPPNQETIEILDQQIAGNAGLAESASGRRLRRSSRASGSSRRGRAHANAANQTADHRQRPTMKDAVMVFSRLELATLAVLHLPRKKGPSAKAVSREEKEKASMALQESFRRKPIQTATELLDLLRKNLESLERKKRTLVAQSASTMETYLFDSIKRNSDSIKQNEYPFLSFESLLKEIVYPASGKGQPDNCFLAKNCDVSTQLVYENGLLMQFEAARWHKEAFELLQIGLSTTQRQKVMKFLNVVKIFFDLNIQDNCCKRGRGGYFMGVVLYGADFLFVAIRLYHVLLVRLYSAYLQAEIDVAEWEFRNNCDAVGKARLNAKNPNAYLPDLGKMAMGFKPLKLPPTEGTAEEKMGRFLEALNKKETKSRASSYSVHQFEKDVIMAVGVQGNKFFTMPRILMRIREAVNGMDEECLDSFERYWQQVSNGVTDAEKQYEEESQHFSGEWLFKFQASYSDSYIDDEWGSVGECGEVSRVKVDVVKMGTPPWEKNEEVDDSVKKRKRSVSSAGRGMSGKKKKCANLT